MKTVFLLQASSTVVKGGSEIQADLIMNELLKGRHEAYYVSDLIGTPKPGRKNVKYFYLKSYGTRYSILNVVSLLKVLKRINPDLIYQRFRVAYTGIAAWYSKRHSSKMVFNIANENDSRKNRITLNRLILFNFINEYLGRYGIRNASAIVAQTYDQQRIIKQNFNRGSVVIRNGHPVPYGPFEKSMPPIILWVANIKPLKRLELFLDLAKELEDTNAKFFYVGRPSSGVYQRMLDDRAKNLKNVSYVGELSFENTNALFSKASVLVNTSTREGFPNTFVQAWMRETPVVSLNVDPDNLVEEKKIGFCSGSFDQLVKDVGNLIEDEETRQEMGKRARQYAIEDHDIKKTGRKYLDLFEKLVNS